MISCHMAPVTHHAHTPRRGSLLVVVAGVAALLAITATAVLLRVQTDAKGNRLVLQDAQCDLALTAALHHLLETSRLGWHETEEAYGWVDIRDGQPGPRTRSNNSLSTSGWPALGSTMRGDLHSYVRPPYAIDIDPMPARLALGYYPEGVTETQGVEAAFFNDMDQAVANFTSLSPTSNWTGSGSMQNMWRVMLRAGQRDSGNSISADPVRFQNRVMMSPHAAVDNWSDFASGDLTVDNRSLGLGWFRIYRETAGESQADDFLPGSTFVITVGAGGSRGFRDWAEASASGIFPNQRIFENIRAQERIRWYRVRWQPQVGGSLDMFWRYAQSNTSGRADFVGYFAWPVSTGGQSADRSRQGHQMTMGRWLTDAMLNVDHGRHNQRHKRIPPQQGGSIDWIHRMSEEPDTW